MQAANCPHPDSCRGSFELEWQLPFPVKFDSSASLNSQSSHIWHTPSEEWQLRAKSTALHTKYSAAAMLNPQPCLLNDDTAFNVACALGHVRVMMALDNAGARRNIVCSNGMTALHAAAAKGQAAVVEYLVSKPEKLFFPDVDQDLQTPNDLNTALHLACASGCDESVKVLMKCMMSHHLTLRCF